MYMISTHLIIIKKIHFKFSLLSFQSHYFFLYINIYFFMHFNTTTSSIMNYDFEMILKFII